MDTTIAIKTETADAIRAAAPALGLVPSPSRRLIAPGVEALDLEPLAALKFEQMRRAAKVSADVMVKRILRKATA